MGVKELFSAIVTLLFHYRKFWRDLKDVAVDDEFMALRDYAVPVIALVQLAKFPLIGQPRQAMMFSIADFLIDIAALYLMMGVQLFLVQSLVFIPKILYLYWITLHYIHRV